MKLFSNSNQKSLSSLKQNDLQKQIDDLANQLEETLEENSNLYFEKAMSDYVGAEPMTGSFGLVGEQYDKGMLQKLFMTETWFYIAVNTIAKTIASLPFKLEKKKIIKQNVIQPNGEIEEVFKETWIEASAEPEASLFIYPNDMQTQMEFWYLIVADLLATGDAYIHPLKDTVQIVDTPQDRLRDAIQRVRHTDVEQLIRLNSAIVEAVASDEEDKVLDGYAVTTAEETLNFGEDEVIHLRMPNPSDPFYGLAPIVAVMKKVLLDKYTDEHHIRFYKQGARLGGVIETTKKLTKDQMQRLTKTFESNFTGKRQHHKTLILPEGMKYNIIEQSPVDSALIEFAKANKEPILSAYNLPPIKVGLLDGATFSNALIQNKTFYVDTIMPIATLISQAINKSEAILTSQRNLRFGFDFSEIEALQEDYKAKSDSAKGMLDSGMTVNEVRERVWGLPPIEGGDVTPAISAPAFNPLSLLSAPTGEEKVDTGNAQNDTVTNTDIVPTDETFEARVSQLIAQAVAEGLDLAIATERAITQAFEEGFIPSRVDEESKAIKHVHVDSSGNNTGPAVQVNNDGLHFHFLLDDEGNQIGQTSSDNDEARHTHTDTNGTTSGPRGGKFIAAPFSKEVLGEYSKVVSGDGVASYIDERKTEYVNFMKRLESFIISKVGKKAYRKEKGFGIKVSLPSESDLKLFINKESKDLAESLIKAAKHGFKYNIPSHTIVFPNEEALKILKKIATRNIKSVSQTSLKQLKNIITSSVDDQVSVGEIAARIQDAFGNITSSKAETIARTETLSAVSIGQNIKSKEFAQLFPKDSQKLKRVWITARDAKVRDSHEDLEGDVVEIGKKFANGLEYPRDPQGEASEVINCRCSFVDFLPEDQDDVLSIASGGSPLADETK